MFAHATALLTRIAQLFNGKDIIAIGEFFVFPLPVQVGRELLLFHSADQMAEALQFYRTRNAQQGLAPSTPKIAAIGLPRNGRFRLWVDWSYPTATNTASKTQNIYYCSTIGGRVMIEMVQYLRIAAEGELIAPIKRIA